MADYKQASPRRQAKDLIDRRPPYDLDAERCFLASVMLLPDALDQIVPELRPDDFYDRAHGVLCKHLYAMHAGGRCIDIVLFVSRLKTAGELEEVGGTAYISQVFNAVPNAANLVHYADIVREKSGLRKIIEIGTRMLNEAYSDNADPRALSGDFADQLLKSETGTLALPRSIGEVCRTVVKGLRSKLERGCPPALSTGLESASRAGCLLAGGELGIFAARPGGGKTSFMTQTAVYQARQGRKVLFASLEMKAETVAERQLNAAAGINGHSVRKCGADALMIQDLDQACVKFDGLPLLIWDPGRINVAAIRSMAGSIRDRVGLDLLIVDYTTWIDPADYRQERRQQVGEIVRGLRSIAQRFDIPVLLGHQLNRDSDKERPKLSHLRESGSVEEDADLVVFLEPVNVAEGTPEMVNLIVAKNRMGTTGETSLLWFRESTSFAEREDFEDTRDANRHPEFNGWNARSR